MGMTAMRASKSLVHLAAATLAVGALTTAAACSDDESTEKTTATTAAASTMPASTAPASTAPADQIVFAGQWARTSPSAVTVGAAYVTITSPIDDALIGVSVDASVAMTAELHEMVMAGMDTGTTMMGGSATTMMGGSATTEGAMTMQPVDRIELPAGQAVELKPGSYHIMLMELAKPLVVGDTIQITLTFEKAGDITIDVPVLDEAP